MQFACPKCEAVLQIPDEYAGQRVGCNLCQAKFTLPPPAPMPEPAPEPIPEPVPDPVPEPTPEPEPDPVPEPTPEPVTEGSAEELSGGEHRQERPLVGTQGKRRNTMTIQERREVWPVVIVGINMSIGDMIPFVFKAIVAGFIASVPFLIPYVLYVFIRDVLSEMSANVEAVDRLMGF